MHKNCANENIWRIAILKRLIQLAEMFMCDWKHKHKHDSASI